jgi:hypothetical protein
MDQTTDERTDPAATAVTVGLTSAGRERLGRFKEEGHFADMTDAYRFAVALALAYGAEPDPSRAERKTFVNVGTLDSNGALSAAIVALRGSDEDPYRASERLAEWGAAEMERLLEEHGTIPVAQVMAEARRHAGGTD